MMVHQIYSQEDILVKYQKQVNSKIYMDLKSQAGKKIYIMVLVALLYLKLCLLKNKMEL